MLLARLSVFIGEFELEAAEAICGGAPLDRDEVLDLLGQLIEKSLLQPSGESYLLLESIREFAREQLEAAGEFEDLIVGHITYYTELVEEIGREGEGPRQREAFDRLDAVLANVRAAVERALARRGPDGPAHQCRGRPVRLRAQPLGRSGPMVHRRRGHA